MKDQPLHTVTCASISAGMDGSVRQSDLEEVCSSQHPARRSALARQRCWRTSALCTTARGKQLQLPQPLQPTPLPVQFFQASISGKSRLWWVETWSYWSQTKFCCWPARLPFAIIISLRVHWGSLQRTNVSCWWCEIAFNLCHVSGLEFEVPWHAFHL